MIDQLAPTVAPLGRLEGERWTPLAAGFFLAQEQMLWFVTTARAAQDAGQSAAVWLRRGPEPVLLGLGNVMAESGLSWVVDPSHDVAACLFPARQEWAVKAFSTQQCLAGSDLPTGGRCVTLNFPYGLDEFDVQRTEPLVLSGHLAGARPARGALYASLPAVPFNAGAPLVLVRESGGQLELFLAGVLLGPCVPEPQPLVQCLQGGALIEHVGALLAGDAAQAMRDKALAGGQEPPSGA